MKNCWLVIIAILFSSNAFSYTLIISDIDDTIKVSHVLNNAGKVANALNVTKPFTGMAQLYQLLLNQNPQASRIVYLSNAPKEVAGIPAMKLSHEAFLSYNNFPAGELDLRADIFNPHHKITELRRLLSQERPDLVILIGDNGERDPEIYYQAAREFGAKMRIVSFIHILYASKKPMLLPKFMAETGSKLYPGQIGYVTPVEIALELQSQKILRAEDSAWMIKNILPRILDEDSLKVETMRSLSFPFFASCDDFKWRWPLVLETAKLNQKIKKMCQ